MDRPQTHSTYANPRMVLRRIGEILDENPHLADRYETAKKIIRIFRKPAFYEITQRCNLKCEGCYYFEGNFQPVPEEGSLAAWEAFFASEAERGVSIAYFVGAEPALEQERLVAASRAFACGNVGTNGTVKIDPVVPYRISISMWAGDDDTDRKLRGAAVFRKAFKNYIGDPRVLVYFTLSRWNLGTARTVVEMCRDHGFPLTFNLYSPSITFLQKLASHSANDRDFFRVSKQGDTPMFSDADLLEARRTVETLMDEFPETVLYSKAYNDWSTRPGSMHEIDENGLAPRCGSRILGHMNYYGSDLKQQHPKCCTPDLDCSQCRIMSGGWSTRLQPDAQDLSNGEAFATWMDVLEALNRIFVFENKSRASAQELALAGAAARR